MAVVGGLVIGRQMKGRLPVSGSFSLSAFMALQADGFWYDFATSAGLFQTTDESTPVTTTGQSIGRVNDRRTGPNSPRNATQVTAGSRPAFQTTGAEFDGTADDLLTDYVAGAGANFIVTKVTVPASVGATQVISGARQSSSLLMYLGVTATGALRANVGGTDQDIAVDLRGQTAVVGLSNQGGVLRSFVLGSAMAEGAHAGGVSTTLVLPIGSYFSGGGTTSFFGGSIHKVVAGREFIDLARFNQIASQL